MSTVLVVEDDPAILDAVSYNLKRDGYNVVSSSDGLDGLRLAREVDPDLIVLDLMLPRMSGLDLCRIVPAPCRSPHTTLASPNFWAGAVFWT